MKSPAPECSLIIPTRNRRAVLTDTLSRIEALPDAAFEVIVVDNGSTDGTPALRDRYTQVKWIELGANLGAAARNVGAAAAAGWLLLMLDDDSWPAEGTIDGLVELFQERLDLGAAALRVRLADPPHAHDAGGVPGVIFNCGGAVRRSAFVEAGGYPVDFEYYVEEYDLCCRLWQRGWRIEPRGDLLVWHRRVGTNRDANHMLRLLVRNNLRLWQRYAPQVHLDGLHAATVERYGRIAEKEGGVEGFQRGLAEGRAEIASHRVRRRPLTPGQYEALMGLRTARRAAAQWADKHGVRRAGFWSRGKGSEALLDLLSPARIEVEAVYDHVGDGTQWRGRPLRRFDRFDPAGVDGVVVGSLSCGVAEDLRTDLEERFPGVPVLCAAPWVQHEHLVPAGAG
jgi:GT2 family glycosyltransferase